jgi:hypothetical protein
MQPIDPGCQETFTFFYSLTCFVTEWGQFCQKLNDMRKMLFGVLLFISSTIFGQDSIPIIDGKYKYVKIIEVDSTNKNELYNRAKIWISQVYKQPEKVIILDDKESGNIFTKSIIYSWMSGTYHNVYCTTKISLKDNKVKIEISDFVINDGGSDSNLENWNTNKRKLKLCLESVNKESVNLLNVFHKGILTKESKW